MQSSGVQESSALGVRVQAIIPSQDISSVAGTVFPMARAPSTLPCPVCSQPGSVYDTRGGKDATIRRKRRCPRGHEFSSWELVVEAGAFVRKRSGRLEPFDEDKLRRSIRLATASSAAKIDQDAIVQDIWAHVRSAPVRTNDVIATTEIGQLVLRWLLREDRTRLAALRFASVFFQQRDFTSREELLDAIDRAEDPGLFVVKRPPREGVEVEKRVLEPFDHGKLTQSIRRALNKTGYEGRIDEVAREVAEQIYDEATVIRDPAFHRREIDALTVGRIVLDRLRRLAWLPYARFLSAFEPQRFEKEAGRPSDAVASPRRS